MNSTRTRRLVIIATLVGAASTGAVLASTAFADSPQRPVAPRSVPASRPQVAPASRPWTPNDCVRMNQGDYVACNVGNSGRGDLQYRPVDTGRERHH